jgi:hypothetical protein
MTRQLVIRLIESLLIIGVISCTAFGSGYDKQTLATRADSACRLIPHCSKCSAPYQFVEFSHNHTQYIGLYCTYKYVNKERTRFTVYSFCIFRGKNFEVNTYGDAVYMGGSIPGDLKRMVSDEDGDW